MNDDTEAGVSLTLRFGSETSYLRAVLTFFEFVELSLASPHDVVDMFRILRDMWGTGYAMTCTDFDSTASLNHVRSVLGDILNDIDAELALIEQYGALELRHRRRSRRKSP